MENLRLTPTSLEEQDPHNRHVMDLEQSRFVRRPQHYEHMDSNTGRGHFNHARRLNHTQQLKLVLLRH